MKKWMEQFRVEDWVVVWVSIPLLALAAIVPAGLPKVPATLLGGAAWSNIAYLFAVVLAVLYVGCLLLRRPLRGLLPSLAVVFAVSLLAQIVAKIPAVSYYGFESVFFSVLFGLVIRNVWRVPEWMKPAIQGEFYIKIGVVCLGATILFSDVMKSGVFGLAQACLVVAVVWFFAYWVSRRMKVDERTAMVLSSGVSICGVSACITAARVAGGDDRKLSYIVSLVLIVVVPMIYLMPWLANTILPLIFDDPHVVQEVAGAERADRRRGFLHRPLPLDPPRRKGRSGSVAGHRVGEVPEIHHRLRRGLAGFQHPAEQRPVYGRCEGQTRRTGRRQDVLDGLFLAGLRLCGA